MRSNLKTKKNISIRFNLFQDVLIKTWYLQIVPKNLWSDFRYPQIAPQSLQIPSVKARPGSIPNQPQKNQEKKIPYLRCAILKTGYKKAP